MGIACSWSRCIDGFPRSSRPSRSSVPRLSYVGIEPASVCTGGGNPALLEADRRLLPVSVVGCYFWVDRPLALFAHDQTKQFDISITLTYIPEVLTAPVLRRVRGTRTARIEQSTPVKTPNDSGIGCGNPGDRRTAQGPAQIHFRGLRHAYDQCPAVAPNRDPGRRTRFTRFVDSMLGFPGRPMSRADVDRKFKSNVSRRWPQEHTDTVLQALWALDRTDDLSSVLNKFAFQT